ncbi:MAG: hypothetical protein RXR51_03545 [Nitrososphaeria archaeon]
MLPMKRAEKINQRLDEKNRRSPERNMSALKTSKKFLLLKTLPYQVRSTLEKTLPETMTKRAKPTSRG